MDRWRLLVQTTGLLGAIIVAGSLWVLVRDGASWQQFVIAGALAVGSFVVLRNLLLFEWRGQRVALAPDEALVFVALLSLPAPLVILFALPTMSFFQFSSRRGLMRGIANAAVLILATAAAVGTFTVARATGLSPIIAAAIAIPAYTLATFLFVSAFFALKENTNALLVFRERFVVPLGFHVLVGVAGGLAVIALWAIHPIALVALVPLGLLLKTHAQLMAKSDREAVVRAKLGDVTRSVVGEANPEAVAKRIIDTCAEVFHSGRVTIQLTSEGSQSWSADYPGGFDPARAALVEPIPAEKEGTIGTITVHRTRETNEAFGPTDRLLLRIIAGEAASAFANARALRALEESRAALLSSRVARPLVHRMVRGLLEESRTDSHVLMQLGQGLAREAKADDLSMLCAAYADMGLGSLSLQSSETGQYSFVGNDLFERQPNAHMTTCHIALGFLVGAVTRLNEGATARGAEVECQSRGDAACKFVVHARALDASRPARAVAGAARAP